MRRPSIALSFVAMVAMMLPGEHARASIVANGDFSAPGATEPFAAWTTTYGQQPADGGGWALFAESNDFGQTELEQTFHLPNNALKLSFEYLLESSGSGAAIPPDSFQATLFYNGGVDPFPTPADPAFPAFYSIDRPGDGGPGFESIASLASIELLSNGWKRVSLDVSSLPAQDVLLEFVLNGGDDGWSTTLSLDNVNVDTQTNVIPEPVSAVIWLIIGLPALLLMFRSRKR